MGCIGATSNFWGQKKEEIQRKGCIGAQSNFWAQKKEEIQRKGCFGAEFSFWAQRKEEIQRQRCIGAAFNLWGLCRNLARFVGCRCPPVEQMSANFPCTVRRSRG